MFCLCRQSYVKALLFWSNRKDHVLMPRFSCTNAWYFLCSNQSNMVVIHSWFCMSFDLSWLEISSSRQLWPQLLNGFMSHLVCRKLSYLCKCVLCEWWIELKYRLIFCHWQIMWTMFKLIKHISLQCICVDTAHVAVSPEEVVNQVPNQVCIPIL